ncbi:hypothetical protein BB560_005131 [Smittium megazygosporum]|uniref:Uncharacterized protein n=1 Tax=Smittium megazygosporum TaxID=133381 RepID=A0A2T9Z7A9_9FUNG|nr:hypothetical protein BB560_005131 [Smittium megazygosporum]
MESNLTKNNLQTSSSCSYLHEKYALIGTDSPNSADNTKFSYGGLVFPNKTDGFNNNIVNMQLVINEKELNHINDNTLKASGIPGSSISVFANLPFKNKQTNAIDIRDYNNIQMNSIQDEFGSYRVGYTTSDALTEKERYNKFYEDENKRKRFTNILPGNQIIPQDDLFPKNIANIEAGCQTTDKPYLFKEYAFFGNLSRDDKQTLVDSSSRNTSESTCLNSVISENPKFGETYDDKKAMQRTKKPKRVSERCFGKSKKARLSCSFDDKKDIKNTLNKIKDPEPQKKVTAYCANTFLPQNTQISTEETILDNKASLDSLEPTRISEKHEKSLFDQFMENYLRMKEQHGKFLSAYLEKLYSKSNFLKRIPDGKNFTREKGWENINSANLFEECYRTENKSTLVSSEEDNCIKTKAKRKSDIKEEDCLGLKPFKMCKLEANFAEYTPYKSAVPTNGAEAFLSSLDSKLGTLLASASLGKNKEIQGEDIESNDSKTPEDSRTIKGYKNATKKKTKQTRSTNKNIESQRETHISSMNIISEKIEKDTQNNKKTQATRKNNKAISKSYKKKSKKATELANKSITKGLETSLETKKRKANRKGKVLQKSERFEECDGAIKKIEDYNIKYPVYFTAVDQHGKDMITPNTSDIKSIQDLYSSVIIQTQSESMMNSTDRLAAAEIYGGIKSRLRPSKKNQGTESRVISDVVISHRPILPRVDNLSRVHTAPHEPSITTSSEVQHLLVNQSLCTKKKREKKSKGKKVNKGTIPF